MSKTSVAKNSTPSEALLSKIIERVHAHAMNMIYLANHRDDIEKGDPVEIPDLESIT